MAGINHSPSAYNPFDGSDNSEDIKNRTLTVLITYNDMTKEERKTIKADIISNFISGSQKGGDDNE